jgi:plasmid stabilization system protein ParE
MRSVRLSKTYDDEFEVLLAQGLPRFGVRVIRAKRDLVERCIQDVLAHHPRRPVDPELGLCVYPVGRTPFVLLYDYDDYELRIHLIIHGAMDRTSLDLSTVVW